MRIPKRPFNENLDSLMDTMANVIGILVIILAFSHIGISGAVRNLIEKGANEEEIQRTAKKLEASKREYQSVKKQYEAKTNAQTSQQAKLDEIKKKIKTADAAIKKQKTIKKPDSQNLNTINETKLKLKTTQNSIKKLREEISKLNLLIVDEQGEATKNFLRLPDPRPASKDSKSVIFFLRWGRIYSYDALEIYKSLANTLDKLGRIKNGAYQLGNYRRFVKKFNIIGPGNNIFELSAEKDGEDIILKTVWLNRFEAESLKDISANDSKFRQRIASLNKDGHVIQYIVWNDSFDLYLKARSISDQSMMPASWEAYDMSEEHTRSLSKIIYRFLNKKKPTVIYHD